MFTEEQAKELLNGAMPEIRKGLVESMKRDLVQQLSYTMSEHVQREVKAFMEKEIVPEIKVALLDNKPVILKAALAMADSTTSILQEAMIQQVKDKLKDSWSRKAVLKALFD